ncbi:MAG: hypothetical protein JXM71_12260, partial [Spirochaetales bacterium]|nr:hypothetical protein [Spirochaetales bacterium]
MKVEDARVHLSFRFHVNLYHSYRGDSLDERGIGKDIRVIRSILDDLDGLSGDGVGLRCAWDMENYFSLEQYLPRYAPDIVDRIRRRVEAGLDEIELMSWNNGIMTAHTRDEFRAAIGWAIHNDSGSGVADLFPSWVPIVRPQECMFTAAHIPEYRALGVEALSVYYSAIPFNGFGSFIPALPTERRYNPMTIVDPASGQGMRLLPACNHADIVEHWLSLRRWLVSMRRAQLATPEARDLMLIIDMDADDSFWTGYLPRALRSLVPSAGGLRSMARSLAGLPWLEFTRPWDYLAAHDDLGTIELGQDLADGAWDGYSSWAEKSENARLWPVIERARKLDTLAARLEDEAASGASTSGSYSKSPSRDASLAPAALTERLLAMSTTHFGMASPVMNADRLNDGFKRAQAALGHAAERFKLAAARVAAARTAGGAADDDGGAWYFDQAIDGLPPGRGAIVTLAREENQPLGIPVGAFSQDASGETVARVVTNPASSRVADFAASDDTPARGAELVVETNGIRDGSLHAYALPEGGAMVEFDGRPIFSSPLSRPWVEYGKNRIVTYPGADAAVTVLQPGRVAELRLHGGAKLPEGGTLSWTHVYTLAAGTGAVVVDVSVSYPRTPHRGYKRDKAARLARTWDASWRG